MKTLLVFTLLLPALALADFIEAPVPEAERLFANPAPAALDAKLPLLYRLARTRLGSKHPAVGSSIDAVGVQVTLRFRTTADERKQRAVEAAGCALSRLPSGRVAQVGRVLEGRCRWSGLSKLLSLDGLVLVSPTTDAPIVRPSMPVSHVASQLEVTSLRQTEGPLRGRGAGVVIADIDSGLDPFHPLFFRADGGAFAWIDVNHNGVFDPRIDAVDFNRDGLAEPEESLAVMKSQVTWEYGLPSTYVDPTPYLPGVDWLYQDENGNGTRDHGAQFGDQKPTFGEQLFVGDDVNRNGVLDVGEKVIALKTPKLKALLIKNNSGTQELRRGVDLSQLSLPNAGDEFHGSMVVSTLAGGDPDYLRYAGMAPDADIVLANDTSQSLITALAWATEQGARLALWEMANWTWEALDGSSNHEAACDDADANSGMVQIGAAGNLGGSDKHRVSSLPSGLTNLPLVIPPSRAQYVWGNFNWRGPATDLSFRITVDNTTVDVPATGSSGSLTAGTASVDWSRWTSPRGTNILYWSLSESGKFAGQTAQFQVTNAGAAATVHGYVSDDFTSWEKGVYWSTGASDFGTYGTPGVSDRTLSVGTMMIDFIPQGQTAGRLVSWSGKGPRIDGQDTVDIVVPEDGIAAWSNYQYPQTHGYYMVGGGTSNASPALVGILALLAELNPTATPTELKTMLLANAETQAFMGALPNDSWGHGMGRAYRAQHAGATPPVSQPPTAVGTASWDAANGKLVLDATGSADPEGQPLSYRWDDDYDGTYDVGPSPNAVLSVDPPLVLPTQARLQVTDVDGFSSVTLVAVPPAPSVLGTDTSKVTLASVPATLGPPPTGCGCSTLEGVPLLLCIAGLSALRRRKR